MNGILCQITKNTLQYKPEGSDEYVPLIEGSREYTLFNREAIDAILDGLSKRRIKGKTKDLILRDLQKINLTKMMRLNGIKGR